MANSNSTRLSHQPNVGSAASWASAAIIAQRLPDPQATVIQDAE